MAPGVEAIPTYGHTPGHQSFMVTLEPALADDLGVPGFVFAFDAADLTENIEEELPVGSFIDVEPTVTAEANRKLKRIAADRGYRLIPGHDPVAWPTLTAELAARWPITARRAEHGSS